MSFDEQNDESGCVTIWSWFQAARLRTCAVREFFNTSRKSCIADKLLNFAIMKQSQVIARPFLSHRQHLPGYLLQKKSLQV